MGICLSVSSSDQIHNADSEQGHENAVLFCDHQYGRNETDLHGLCSVYSKEGSKGLNQDSAILYQDFGRRDRVFCGVFDGHGTSGHVVSEMVRNRLPILLLSHKEDSIADSFEVMDQEIKLQAQSDFSCSGTTAVVAIRQEEDLILANLGDSRAVLGTMINNGIKAVQLTTDLKPSVPSEAERIRSNQGRVLALKNEPHIQRVWLPDEDAPGLAMSRAFGDILLKDYGVIAEPDVTSHRITPEDQFIVLATDGVWDVMSNEQAVAAAWGAASEASAAKAVVDAASSAWKRRFPNAKVDDITVVCLFLQKPKRHVVSVKS